MVIRTLKILAGLLVYENLPQIQSKLFQCNDLPLFVLFFRGNSRITLFHQNQPPSNVFSKHIVRLPPTADTSLRKPVGGDVNSGGAAVQVLSAYSGALTNGCRQVDAEGLAAIGGGVGASIAFV